MARKSRAERRMAREARKGGGSRSKSKEMKKEEERGAKELEAKLAGSETKEEKEEYEDFEDHTLAKAMDAIMITTATTDKKVASHARDVHVDRLTMSLFGTELLVDADLKLAWGRRYGLLAPNGSGKVSRCSSSCIVGSIMDSRQIMVHAVAPSAHHWPSHDSHPGRH